MSLAIVAAVGVLTPAVVSAPAEAHPPVAADPAVITEWDVIANRTIFVENATPAPSSNLYFGYVSIAVYDALQSRANMNRTILSLAPTAILLPK